MLKITKLIRYPKHELPLTYFVNEYRKIYQEVVDLFDEFNPCDIHDCACWRSRRRSGPSFCCDDCDYLTDDGCRAESIWCKLWICGPLKQAVPYRFAKRLNALVIRSSKICHGYGGRTDLSDYLYRFYGEKEFEEWKTTEMKSDSISSMSAR